MVETHGVAGDSKAQIRAAPHHGWATPLRWLGTARCPRTRRFDTQQVLKPESCCKRSGLPPLLLAFANGGLKLTVSAKRTVTSSPACPFSVTFPEHRPDTPQRGGSHTHAAAALFTQA